MLIKDWPTRNVNGFHLPDLPLTRCKELHHLVRSASFVMAYIDQAETPFDPEMAAVFRSLSPIVGQVVDVDMDNLEGGQAMEMAIVLGRWHDKVWRHGGRSLSCRMAAGHDTGIQRLAQEGVTRFMADLPYHLVPWGVDTLEMKATRKVDELCKEHGINRVLGNSELMAQAGISVPEGNMPILDLIEAFDMDCPGSTPSHR